MSPGSNLSEVAKACHSYVGAIGRDLLRVTDLFNPNPNFQSVGITDNSAASNYDALQVKFQRRLSQGLQALA
jgi:hypothetical protein